MNGIPAAACARYSSDNQREESIEAQLRAIREYAARSGYEIINKYVDEARSATTDNRPAFQQMIADADQFKAIIVHKLDRFSRDRYNSAIYRRQLKKKGVSLVSVLENLDGSPESIILESVLEGMAEYYSRNLAREVMKGLRETAYKCKHTGGIPPLGYDVLPDKSYTINDREAEEVRLIFKMYAAGRGYKEIIAALNAEGMTTKTGGAFGKNSISDILRNEKYTGTFVYNRATTMVRGRRNNHASKSADEIIKIPGGIPQIVDDVTWRATKKRLSDNVRKGANKAKTVYLLRGKIRCAKCGSIMNGACKTSSRTGTPLYYYLCGNRDRKGSCTMRAVRKDFIEGFVLGEIKKLLSIDVEKVAQKIVALTGNALEPEYLKKARRQLSSVQKQIKSIVSAIKAGAFHLSMADELKKLSQEENRLQEICKEVPAAPDIGKIRMLVAETLRIDEMDEYEKRALIGRMVDEVVCYGKDEKPQIKWGF